MTAVMMVTRAHDALTAKSLSLTAPALLIKMFEGLISL